MTSETKPPISPSVGTTVKKDLTFLGFQIASTTNLLFHPSYQQILDGLNEQIKMMHSAIRFELQNKETLEKDLKKSSKSVNELEERCARIDKEKKRLERESQTTTSTLRRLKSERERLVKTNVKLTEDTKRLGGELATAKNNNRKLKNDINEKTKSSSEFERQLRNVEKQKKDIEIKMETLQVETDQQMLSLKQQSANNENYLQLLFNQRNSPAALQLLQKRIKAPSTKMNPDESIFTLPLPCLQEKVQQSHQSVATMKVSAAIFSKEDAPASVSQDACSFGEVEGRLTFAVADGVSTSNRQSEWSKRLVSACIGPEKLRESRFKNAQIQHKEDGEKLTPLIEGNLAWVWEEKLAKQSDATLLTGHIEPDGNARLHRRGDTWAAMKKKNGRKWTIVFMPSAVNGTQAVNSNSPLVFDESTDLSEVSKLLVMTDGVASSDSKFLDELWSKVTEKKPDQLSELVRKGRHEKTFENDDITILAIDTRGFRHN